MAYLISRWVPLIEWKEEVVLALRDVEARW